MDIGLWLYGPPGLAQITPREGVFGGRRAGGTTVLTTQTLATDGVTVVVLRDDPDLATATEVARIASLAERPNLPDPRPDACPRRAARHPHRPAAAFLARARLARSCRCCSTPTAARTPSGCWPPAARS